MLKLQGGTLGPIQIATKAVRKAGTLQIIGVYGGLYNMFPLGPFFIRNINIKMGQAPAVTTCLISSRKSNMVVALIQRRLLLILCP
ncbi:hypothetical protein BACCIP111883_01163 [Sutcliffiella rhizosphaerae]|uniref:Uncharacterized protein n=1 Tax=Sutcliffiella rhizosphaerae TaxID=2880967 RepID=A0ABM8YKX3_9BACI|nr:hypothetical protein BACCIP111883_01163 [Sutcliffiella rhizosphaerae]